MAGQGSEGGYRDLFDQAGYTSNVKGDHRGVYERFTNPDGVIQNSLGTSQHKAAGPDCILLRFQIVSRRTDTPGMLDRLQLTSLLAIFGPQDD